MNKRQKKKAFKKKFGVNPPKNIKLQYAIVIFENKETLILAIKRFTEALLIAWDKVKEPFLRFAEEVRKAAKEIKEKQVIDQQNKGCKLYMSNAWTNLRMRQQESEEMKVEGNINILNHDRR